MYVGAHSQASLPAGVAVAPASDLGSAMLLAGGSGTREGYVPARGPWRHMQNLIVLTAWCAGAPVLTALRVRRRTFAHSVAGAVKWRPHRLEKQLLVFVLLVVAGGCHDCITNTRGKGVAFWQRKHCTTGSGNQCWLRGHPNSATRRQNGKLTQRVCCLKKQVQSDALDKSIFGLTTLSES